MNSIEFGTEHLIFGLMTLRSPPTSSPYLQLLQLFIFNGHSSGISFLYMIHISGILSSSLCITIFVSKILTLTYYEGNGIRWITKNIFWFWYGFKISATNTFSLFYRARNWRYRYKTCELESIVSPILIKFCFKFFYFNFHSSMNFIELVAEQ